MPEVNRYNWELDDSDKRYFPRWEVANRLTFRLDNGMNGLHGQTMDISCTGARFTTDHPLQPQQTIDLILFLNEATAVTLKAHVIWVKVDDVRHIVGVDFIETSPEAQEIIMQHAFNINKDQLVKHWFQGWEDKTE